MTRSDRNYVESEDRSSLTDFMTQLNDATFPGIAAATHILVVGVSRAMYS